MSESIGPQIPSHLLPTVSATADDDSDEDDYMPALPPDLTTARTKTGPSLPPKVYGPAFPTVGPSETKTRAGPSCYSDYSDGDSDSEVGPRPPPAHFTSANAPNEGNSAVEEFLEREERRRKNVEEAKKPKKLEREEWMLVPPKSGDLLTSLDPTKLKARQFGRSSGQGRDVDSSLWTETPAERQQRLADEVSGRKRKAANAEPVEDPEDARKKKKRDEEIRRGVEEHTRRVRGAALVNSHMEREAQKKGDAGEEPAAIWDHSRDMSVGGRLMDEKQRKQMLREARALGDRFGTGKSGGFL
ncbi:hypothetical protein M404DRAFT_145967 [Pisolithus tinctorius Marx 270]|uniref:DUF3752 domain-containing protein n=1 Tax=Pisolithus tinctorius Marx 270 TaxID=870435 RepID=A0A0C3J2D0_PISTI|nr:hypothetical protein M404DRAFT_145967 [Pisolithus tinctorius Marx 270]